MCNIFNVSADYLLFGKEPEKCETLPVHDKIPKPKFISAVFFSVFALLAVSVPFLAKFMQYTDFAATGECYTNYSQYILSFPLVVVPLIAFAFLCAAGYDLFCSVHSSTQLSDYTYLTVVLDKYKFSKDLETLSQTL